MAKVTTAKGGPISQALEELAKVSDRLNEVLAEINETQKTLGRLSGLLRTLAPLDSVVSTLAAAHKGAESEDASEVVSPATGYIPKDDTLSL